MHIYAAAIDPLRKKFGIPARAVAEKVSEILGHNGKLSYDLEQAKKELATANDAITAANAVLAVRDAEVTALKASLAERDIAISESQQRLVAALAVVTAPSTVEG